MAVIPSRPSRKGKKAWRHNIDISAITSGLDAARAETIATGGIIAEQDADQLFATDITGDAELARKQSGRKLLKAEEILAQRSAAPGLERRKRKGDDELPAARTPGAKRIRSGTYLPRKELLRLRAVADMAEGGLKMVEESASHDPWDESLATAAAIENSRLDFLEPAQAPREPKTLKHAPVALTASGKPLPAVRIPDAGKSYNPLVGDWSALLEREGAKAVEAEQERLTLEAAAEDKDARLLAEAQAVEAREREDGGTDYESEWEGFLSEVEEVAVAGRMRGRKTPAERNKIRARKAREGVEKMARNQRERETQERRIAEIIREYKKSNHARSLLVHQGASDSDSDSLADTDVPLRRRRMGQLPLPRAPLEVVLPDELQDSLRRLKPEGNLLTERYRRALVSGMVESSRSRQKKMPKVETREKWSYKDWVLR